VLALAPEARALAFVSDQGSGTFEAWTVPSAGGAPSCALLPEGGAVRSLCWTPSGELDVPVGRVDALADAASRVERREVEVLAVLVGDLEDAAIRQPARGHVLRILAVSRDLARATR